MGLALPFLDRAAKPKPNPFVNILQIPFCSEPSRRRSWRHAAAPLMGLAKFRSALSFSITPMLRRRASSSARAARTTMPIVRRSSSRFTVRRYDRLHTILRPYEDRACGGFPPSRRNWCGFWPDIRETNERKRKWVRHGLGWMDGPTGPCDK